MKKRLLINYILILSILLSGCSVSNTVKRKSNGSGIKSILLTKFVNKINPNLPKTRDRIELGYSVKECESLEKFCKSRGRFSEYNKNKKDFYCQCIH